MVAGLKVLKVSKMWEMYVSSAPLYMGINAIYEDNDIRHIISQIKQQYEKNPWDKRYKIFYHMGSVYEMWFADKKQLWSKRENIEFFQRNLEDCEIGLARRREELNLPLMR
jgi:hypothetical protein